MRTKRRGVDIVGNKQSSYPDWPVDWFVVDREHRPCSVCGRETQYISVTFHCPICSQECDAALYRKYEELERKNGMYAEDLDWRDERFRLYGVTLLCSDGARQVHIDKDKLLQLIENLSQNGKETVHTRKGSYDIKGLVIGEIKGKVLVL